MKKKDDEYITDTKPFISIIICTYNRSKLLKKTLKSLLSLKNIESAEIIIVNNNSTDDTQNTVLQFIEKYSQKVKIKYILETKQGLSIARNRGVNEAEGEVVAFLDDDAVPDSNWILSIQSAFNNFKDAAALGGKIIPLFETDRPSWLSNKLLTLYSVLDLGDIIKKFQNGNYPIGANMAIKKEWFTRFKFNETLGRKGLLLVSGEESMLFKKIQNDGGVLYYIPNMVVTHFIPSDRLNKSWILNRYYFEGVSKAYAVENVVETIKLYLVTILKIIYLKIQKNYLKKEEDKLLNLCRLYSQKGVFYGFKNRKIRT